MSPRSKKQNEVIREDKKEKIMLAALELFADNGIHVTNMDKIAGKAGISKGLIYNYYKSKEELIEKIIDKGFNEMMNLFDPNKDGFLETHEMKYYIEESFHLLQQNRKFWKLYFSISLQPSVFPILNEKIEAFFAPIMKMMIEYFTRRGCQNPMLESIIFGATLDGIAMDYVMKPEVIPMEEIKNELIKRYCC